MELESRKMEKLQKSSQLYLPLLNGNYYYVSELA